ncbi:YdcF family protein [Brevibacillus borstelensis]|uniref:YdcF family protein n=1 Tax=Brevibacillus borstelensis TaxID=45462 RepID=UPI0030BF2521
MSPKKREFDITNLALRGNKMKRMPIKIFYFFVIWFGIHILITTIDGLHDEKHYADVGIVLGNKVESDGKPSDRLKSRLEKAVELYREGYFTCVIVSGGVGVEGYDEAEIMKQYLVKQGIPTEKIITDRIGINTMATAKNAPKILGGVEDKSVMVITQFYHISRTKLAFYKAGFKNVYSAHSDYFELRDLYSLSREFLAYYKYLIFE